MLSTISSMYRLLMAEILFAHDPKGIARITKIQLSVRYLSIGQLVTAIGIIYTYDLVGAIS